MEISTFDPDTQRRVHILCYLPLKPDRLAGLLSRTLEQRRISGEQMIQKVSRLYPVTREHILRYAAASNSIYKVHIMQALLDLGYDTSIYGQLYAQLFSDSGGSCLVKTVYPSLEEVLQTVKQEMCIRDRDKQPPQNVCHVIFTRHTQFHLVRMVVLCFDYADSPLVQTTRSILPFRKMCIRDSGYPVRRVGFCSAPPQPGCHPQGSV